MRTAELPWPSETVRPVAETIPSVTASRVGASLQTGEEDGYGSDDAVHDRGLGPACTDGACGTVSRSTRGGDAADVASSRPRLGGAFRWPLHRDAVTRHG